MRIRIISSTLYRRTRISHGGSSQISPCQSQQCPSQQRKRPIRAGLRPAVAALNTCLSLVSPQGLWGLGQGPTRLLAGKLGGAPVSSPLWKRTGVAWSLRLPPAPALRGALIPSYCPFFFNQFLLGISNSQLSSPFSKSAQMNYQYFSSNFINSWEHIPVKHPLVLISSQLY